MTLARLALPLCLVWASARARVPVQYVLTLEQTGGYASNLLLATDDPASTNTPAGLYRLEPSAALGLGLSPELHLSIHYIGELGVYRTLEGETELENSHTGTVALRWSADRWTVTTRALGSGYTFSAFDDDAHGRVALQLEGAVRLAAARLGLRAGVGGRFFTATSDSLQARRSDLEISTAPTVAWVSDFGLTVEIGYELLWRSSNEPVVDRPLHRPGASVLFRRGRFRASAAWATALRTDLNGELDAFHSVAAGAGVRLASWLELTAGYRVLAERADDSSQSFTAHEATLGFVLGFSGGTSALALSEPPPEEPRPTSTGIRFRTRRPGASRVAVVGDFNQWSPEAAPMSGPDADGWFEITLRIPSGRYEYQFWVDGSFVAPAGAGRTIRSDFGPSNGVLEVR